MKISLNWVQEYTKVDLPIDQLLDKIGSQLGAVEEVINLGEKYQGALIVKVESCEKHPNADHLSVCMINDGDVTKDIQRENGLIKVVCGANNVASGQTVIWLPPGVIVPDTFNKEPFKLVAKELRGIISNGMIASARELDFGDDHEGIAVVDEDIKPGTTLNEAYGLDDYIIDIENKMFTHRPDCFGILGVAREIAGIQGIQFKSPDWYLNNKVEIKAASSNLPLEVKNEAPDLVPRFMAITLDRIGVKPSSLKVKTALARVGVKPINNIVDITNLMMVLTGQPMHAFDYDKVKNLSGDDKAEIIVRLAQKGEKITLLGGKTIEPREGAILITTPKQIIGIGGVMGGADTEVDDSTKNIILEVANFDMYSIRKTAMEHGLFTDAFTRFSKGQSPLQNDKILAEAIKMVQKFGGQVASDLYDDNHAKPLLPVKVSPEFINKRLGLSLKAADIVKTLQNVEFKAELQTPNFELQVTPPFWRTDIAIAEDIVEEVGRLTGFDKIPSELPNRDLTPVATNFELDLNRKIRDVLSAGGANEVLTYSFIHGNLLDRCGQNKDLAYQLNNALSPDLQYFRLSITPSLLEKVHPNIKAGFDQFGLFEIGKIHIKELMNEESVPQELRRLGFVAADKCSKGNAYYQAQKYLNYLLCGLDVEFNLIKIPENAELPANEQLVAPYTPNRSALVVDKIDGSLLGVVGDYRQNVKKALKLPEYCAGFELDLEKLSTKSNFSYRPLSKYPKVEQDISLKVSKDVTYILIKDVISKKLEEIKPENSVIEMQPLDIYQPEDRESKHYTFRVSITPYTHTLRSKEVNELLDQAANEANQQIGAVRL